MLIAMSRGSNWKHVVCMRSSWLSAMSQIKGITFIGWTILFSLKTFSKTMTCPCRLKKWPSQLKSITRSGSKVSTSSTRERQLSTFSRCRARFKHFSWRISFSEKKNRRTRSAPWALTRSREKYCRPCQTYWCCCRVFCRHKLQHKRAILCIQWSRRWTCWFYYLTTC